MAQKMIYVREEDLALFDRAAELGEDSLSAVIAEALRRFVAAKDAAKEGFEEVAIQVGYETERDDNLRTVRFIGREIAHTTTYYGQTSSRDDRGTTFQLYQTPKGKFLLHIRRWTRWQGEATREWYKIYDSLEDIRSQEIIYDDETEASAEIPGSLLDEAEEALGQEVGEFLDI